MATSRSVRIVAFVAIVFAPRTALRAQQDTTATRRDTTAVQLFSRRDGVVLAGAIVATGVLAPLDHEIQRAIRGDDVRNVRDLHHVASALAFTGGPGPFVAGGTLYLAGQVAGSSRLALTGVTLTEGVLVAAALNGFVKGVAGRALPNATTEAGDFSFGRGFHDGNGAFVSFPSGHTAASFAAAAVITDAASTWNERAGRYVGPGAYSIATLVAVSRIYQNVHWASDLPLGAAIGVWSGKTVAALQRRHPNNWLTRQLMRVQVFPSTSRLTMMGSVPSW